MMVYDGLCLYLSRRNRQTFDDSKRHQTTEVGAKLTERRSVEVIPPSFEPSKARAALTTDSGHKRSKCQGLMAATTGTGLAGSPVIVQSGITNDSDLDDCSIVVTYPGFYEFV